MLDEIDGNPIHPVNDANHPLHTESWAAYQALSQWCEAQQVLLEKQERDNRRLFM